MKTKDRFKTIDINLIGERLAKKSVSIPEEEIDEKSKLASIVILSSTFLAFSVCCCVWLGSIYLIKKTNNQLVELQARHEKLNMKLDETTSVYKNMQNEKDSLKFELLVKNQIEDFVLPWHSILVQISKAVPKNIKITKISKASGESDNPEISITGEVNSITPSPLNMISFFVLNINENIPGVSYLSKAVIKSIDFDKKDGKYSFLITTQLKLPQENKQEKKEQGHE